MEGAAQPWLHSGAPALRSGYLEQEMGHLEMVLEQHHKSLSSASRAGVAGRTDKITGLTSIFKHFI